MEWSKWEFGTPPTPQRWVGIGFNSLFILTAHTVPPLVKGSDHVCLLRLSKLRVTVASLGSSVLITNMMKDLCQYVFHCTWTTTAGHEDRQVWFRKDFLDKSEREGPSERKQGMPRAPPSPSLSLLHIPYKDRCDRLPTLCLINIVLPSSPSFSHTLSFTVLHLLFKPL